MAPKRPLRPCPHCTSTRFAHVPALAVILPFVSSARDSVGGRSRAARGRAGEALVCLGCGHIDHFMQSFETLLSQAGVTELRADDVGPYR